MVASPAEGLSVRSWILRHRLRLRLIYGAAQPERTAGASIRSVEASTAYCDGRTRADAPGEPAVAGGVGRLRDVPDGLELVPMPRRVDRGRRVG